MKIKILFASLILLISFTSCEKDEDEQVTPAGPTIPIIGGDTTSVQEPDNNSVKAGNDQISVTSAFVTNLPDNNANGQYYYSIQLSSATSSDGMLTFMREVPATSTTLKYSTSTGATMNTDEFNVSNMRVNNKMWYSVLTTSQTANITVTVNGDKISFSFVDIQLSDSFLSNNVTESKNCSAKFTLSLSELQAAPKDGSATLSLMN